MPEKNRALFRGVTHPDGSPAEWLGVETPNEPGQPETPAVPARHLSAEEFDALTPRNKERVREAHNAAGEPLYEVRSEREIAGAPKATTGENG